MICHIDFFQMVLQKKAKVISEKSIFFCEYKQLESILLSILLSKTWITLDLSLHTPRNIFPIKLEQKFWNLDLLENRLLPQKNADVRKIWKMDRFFRTFLKSFYLFKALHQVPGQQDVYFKSYKGHFAPPLQPICRGTRTPAKIGLKVN